MAIPSVTCGADVVLDYSESTQVVGLSATATNTPISWLWTMLSVPLGSSANVGANGDFVDGVSTNQNPSFSCDASIDGGYTFQCVATNEDGPSNPFTDLRNGQQGVLVRTQGLQLYLPGDYLYDWGDKYLNPTLRALEASALDPTDTDAFHRSVDGEIAALTEADGENISEDDWLLLESTANSNAKRKTKLSTIGGLIGGGGGVWDFVTITDPEYESNLGEFILADSPAREDTLYLTSAEHGYLWVLEDGSWEAVDPQPPIPDVGGGLVLSGPYVCYTLPSGEIILAYGHDNTYGAKCAVLIGDGKTWRQLGDVLTIEAELPIAVSGTADDLWMCRRKSDYGISSTLAHWDGISWTEVIPSWLGNGIVRGLHYNAPDDIWIIAEDVTPGDPGYIFHRTDSSGDIDEGWDELFADLVTDWENENEEIDHFGNPISLFGRGPYVYIGTDLCTNGVDNWCFLLTWRGGNWFFSGYDATQKGILGIWGPPGVESDLWLAIENNLYKGSCLDGSPIGPYFEDPSHEYWAVPVQVNPQIGAHSIIGTSNGQKVVFSFREVTSGDAARQCWTEDGGDTWEDGWAPINSDFCGVGVGGQVNCIITLPAVTGADEGAKVAVKAGSGATRVVASGSSTIDGSSSALINTANGVVVFCVDDSGNWQQESDYLGEIGVSDVSGLSESLEGKQCRLRVVGPVMSSSYNAEVCDLVVMFGSGGEY